MTDGGSGLLKAFSKKLMQQRCVIHTNPNLQRHFVKSYRHEAYRKLTTALEQTRWVEAKQMPQEPEAWLCEAVLSTSPIESLFSLVRHRERTIRTHTRERIAPAVAGDGVD